MATNREAEKTEFTLEVSPYREAGRSRGAVGLARQLQTLLIMEPGTIPGALDAGVGIGSYEYEFMDSSTISDLTTRVSNQLSRFLPNNLIADLAISVVDGEANAKVLAVRVLLKSTNTDSNEKMILALFARKAGSSKGLVSKIVVS
jgi:hypothetical protein